MSNLHENTFGDSPAAISMVKIINERGLNYRKSARLLTRFDKIINDINQVDTTSSIHIVNLLYKESHEICDSFIEPLNTYTQNVLSTKYKKWLVRKNALKPKKNRKYENL